jgi:uncharacterized protein (TIGR02246 family)
MATSGAIYTKQDDEQAIRELVDKWLESTREGDYERVLSLMADDAIFMVPGREPFGKEAFAAQSEQMKGAKIEGKSDIQEIEVIGDRAWMRNHLEITITEPNGQTMTRSGYTLTVLRKEADGRWLLARDANLVS